MSTQRKWKPKNTDQTREEKVEEFIKLLSEADDYDIEIQPEKLRFDHVNDHDNKWAKTEESGRTVVKINLIDIDKYKRVFQKQIDSIKRHKKINNRDQGASIDELIETLKELK